MKHKFAVSKYREKAFAVTLLAIIGVGVLGWLALVMVVSTNEVYLSQFQWMFQKEGKWNWFTSFMLLTYLLIEAVVNFDAVCNLTASVSMLYLCCFSMKFWLQKIWLARSYPIYI